MIGLPGSGKSTLGQLLASHFGLPYVDTDKVIEQESGKSINELFRIYGEKAFREIEAKLLDQLILRAEAHVMATGGGLPVYHDHMDKLLRNATVIYLKVSKAVWLERMKSNPEVENRPLLSNSAHPDLEARYDHLISVREAIYQRANFVLEITEQESIEQSFRRLLQFINQKKAP